MRTLVLTLALSACKSDDPKRDPPDESTPTTPAPTPPEPTPTTPAPVALAFDGIATLAWDGADGLVATWETPPAGAATSFELELTASDGAAAGLVSVAADVREAAIVGLADGEYVARVWGIDAATRQDGGRTLSQLVGANRIVLRGQVEIDGVASVWGEGDIVVVGGMNSGASFIVYDIADPTAPVQLHVQVDGNYTKEIKIGDGLLFTQTECGCQNPSPEWDAYDKIGARIFDFTDPSNPTLLSTIGEPASSIHNLWYEAGFLYLTDNTSNGVRVYDVTNPLAPVEVWEWIPPDAWVHDQAVIRDRLYVSWWDGVTVLDVADPMVPVEIGTYTGFVQNLHNAWPTEDDRYLLTTSEMGGGRLSVLDLQALPTIGFVTDVEAVEPGASSHNTHVRGDYAYTAWYTEGLVVHDVSDPTQPVEVGRYDTIHYGIDPALQPKGVFSGAWGVWPFGAHIAVADMDRGLFLFDHIEPLVTVTPAK